MKKKLLLVPTLIAVAIIVLPLISLLSKVSWSNLLGDISELNSRRAIWLTIWSSTIATFITLILGLPLAWHLSRSKSKVLKNLRVLVLSPLVLPPTVAGLALIAFMGRNGLVGSYIYELTGWSLPFTSWAVVLTGVFVGLPYMTLICESALRQLPQDVEDAAVIDRVDEFDLFRLVSLPQIRSSIAVGTILSWARAVGEFGATLMFAGSMPGITQTWSMAIYQYLDLEPSVAYSLAATLLIVAVLVVFSVRNSIERAFR